MRKLSIVLCLVWMVLIFYNSSRPGTLSNTGSYKIVQSIRNDKNILQGKTNSNKTNPSLLPINQRDEKINIFIRKNAHAFEYFILAVLVSNLLFLFALKGRNALTYIMFICLFYAVTDEYHQKFIAGRGSSVSDVLIDFTGALIGLGFFYLVYYKCFTRYFIKNKKCRAN
ncbi:VanZ family protein [Clostridium lacusfryxellense]|uniref:VanZ family protein n=1 Tax=Clostridium lacusfryxellense TaxID=205328 RepID=UPI001C0C6509|nr:VanZ family protein [Clostridium lacusfryxellense]MBU3111441.1 VanZ family protein [Clostridium lacusfryxellense]